MVDRSDTATVDDRQRTLVIERVFKASPERVFRAWTDPAVLVRWWGPEGFTTPEFAFDLRTGGAWRTVMRSPDGNPHRVSGIYRAIDPPRRLVITWAWEEDDKRGHETEIEITFLAIENGTRMRLVQRLFQSPTSRDLHQDGWTQSFDKLDRLFR
jgi:glutathione S-transferase